MLRLRSRHHKKKKGFDLEEYDRIMDTWVGNRQGAHIGSPPEPILGICKSTMAQYKNVIKTIFKDQVSRKRNNDTWEHIWTQNVERLEKRVKTRKARSHKNNYQEKMEADFSPYTAVTRLEDLESKTWEQGYPSVRSAAAALRNRYVFLHTTSGVLRYESLARADLSDYMSLYVEKPEDLHPIMVMITQLPFGKTNHGRILYGRSMRHRNVFLCSIGGLAFYLAIRFELTEEFLEANFPLENWQHNER